MSLFKRTVLEHFLFQPPDPAWEPPGGPGSTPHGPWTCWALRGMMLDEFCWSRGRTPHPRVDVRSSSSSTTKSRSSQSVQGPELRGRAPGPKTMGNPKTHQKIKLSKSVPGMFLATQGLRTDPEPSELVQHHPPQCSAGPGTVRSRSRASGGRRGGGRLDPGAGKKYA